MRKGIIGFDKQWRVIFEIKLEPGSEPHGLTYCEASRKFFVGQPGRDSIGIYSRDKKTLTELSDINIALELDLEPKKISNILTVGVAFSFQKHHKLPMNKNDVKLDYILTEKGFY
mgnify:CR=1 FL=1